jgi:nicotinic acid mononucleotide adenylyltransferase
MAEKEKKTQDKKGKKSFKEFDPSKYIDTEPTIDEAAKGSVVVSFGRFNPITVGHEKLANKVISEAVRRKADAAIYMSHSQDSKKNPLSYEQKVSLGKKAFGGVVKKSNARTLIEVAKELSGKYENLIVVVGQDRVREFETLVNKYNGKEYNFNSIEIVSAGERDPDADDVTGMSASKMRSLAAEGNMEAFKQGLPQKLKSSAKKVYDMVRDGMNINESLDEEALEERAALTIQQRRKRGLVMKRYRAKIRAARERAKRKMAPKEKLLKRSRKRALEFIRNRLMKNKKYSEMTPSEKVALDTRLQKIPQAVIDRIAKRLLPKVRAAEKERLQSVLSPKQESVNAAFEAFLEAKIVKPQDPDVKDMPGSQPKGYYTGVKKSVKGDRARHFAKYAKKSDDAQSSYKPAPGDAGAKTKPSVHTKKFKQMFGESLDEASRSDAVVRKRPHMAFEKNGSVKFDRRFKMYRSKNEINEDYEDDIVEDLTNLIMDMDNFVMSEEFDALMEANPTEALKKKAEKSGISYGILKKVFDRGVAAWRTGHRPGTTPTQWGLARVNSFATKGKGTWGKADSDLAAKVRKEEISLTLDDLFDLRRIDESDILVKVLEKMHKYVMQGIDPEQIAFDIANMVSGLGSGRQLEKAYIAAYGKPKKKSVGPGTALKKKYGFATEAAESAKMKMKIAQEKMTDARKHDRMLDAAKARDKAAKDRLARDVKEGSVNPSDREEGTDSLVKTYKKDTPGQKPLKEFMITSDYGSFKRGDRIRFNRHSMDMFDGEMRKGTVVGGDVAWLRVRDDDGMLFKVRHRDAVALNEATMSRGFEGKMIKVKNVPVRMADGTIKRLPPGKSSSSAGNGNGNGE